MLEPNMDLRTTGIQNLIVLGSGSEAAIIEIHFE